MRAVIQGRPPLLSPSARCPLEPNVRSDWAVCPHCRAFARQAFLLAANPSTGVRWSTCGACQQTAIWEGAVAVFPGDARTPCRISQQ